MLIVLGVNVFPSARRDVIAGFHPHTTGEIQIVLDEPGPKVSPPLKVVAEYTSACSDSSILKSAIERKIKATLTVPAALDLVPAGTLPRYEMKGQLVRKAYEYTSARSL
jgi:phenylacetate-CoA ligase